MYQHIPLPVRLPPDFGRTGFAPIVVFELVLLGVFGIVAPPAMLPPRGISRDLLNYFLRDSFLRSSFLSIFFISDFDSFAMIVSCCCGER